MSKSKVIDVKVETVYTVEISFSDFVEAKEAFFADSSSGELYRLQYPKAFENDKTTMGILHDEYREFMSHGDRSGFIANFLGYDGWKNGLFYHKNTDTLTIIVYNRGDRL